MFHRECIERCLECTGKTLQTGCPFRCGSSVISIDDGNAEEIPAQGMIEESQREISPRQAQAVIDEADAMFS